MTFHPKTNPRKTTAAQHGFTLLEIIVVLAIAAVIIGGAVTVMVVSSKERKLTNISGEIEVLAKTARAASILHQTPYAIEFREDSINLLPLSEAGLLERKTALGRDIGGTTVESNSKPTVRQSISIDSDISLTIQHWNTTKYITPSKSSIPVWRFDPEGLSEPIIIRINIGESFVQDSYNPLNASISSSESQIN